MGKKEHFEGCFTVKELIEALQALPKSAHNLPVV